MISLSWGNVNSFVRRMHCMISRASYCAGKAALALAVCVLLFALPLSARGAAHTVRLVGAGDTLTYVAQATPLGSSDNAATLQQAIDRNLDLLPFISIVDPRGIPGGATVAAPSAEGIDFRRFGMARAHLLITTNWVNNRQVELRCYEVAQERFIFGNRYTLGNYKDALPDVADKFCADLLEEVIGNGAFFRSRLAFVKRDGRLKSDIWSMLPNGRYLQRLTNLPGYALSPTWSPNGAKVLFTQIDKRYHALGVYDTASKRVQRIKFPGNTVIGPCYMPNGGVAVSLTDGRNPSIFLLNGSFQKQYRLVDSQGIDVSPSVDAAGRYMAFTSSQGGGPQIYLKDLMSGATRLISQAGNYNTDPSISPDGTVVAYARQDAGGHRIFVQDLVTGQERQITFGPGSDEEPAFAPDSYFIVFMSTRNGQRELYITTRNGGAPKRLPTGSGDAAFPAWGPAAK
jgi:TolB protein